MQISLIGFSNNPAYGPRGPSPRRHSTKHIGFPLIASDLTKSPHVVLIRDKIPLDKKNLTIREEHHVVPR